MTRAKRRRLDVESTGDPALDKILGGGIPARSLLVIAGEPGSGKTTLTLQMLFAAARRGKKSLYLTTLSEPSLKVLQYMQLFDFFDPALLDDRVVFSDLGTSARGGASEIVRFIEERIRKHAPDFVVIDSFRALAELLGRDVRSFVYDLAVRMASSNATTLLVGEYQVADASCLPEFVVADGILRLGSERQDLTSVRELEVLKLRGADYLTGRHFFDITTAGVRCYPRVSAPTTLEAEGVATTIERAPSGIVGLDELLGGGLPRGGTTILQGGTGTGKTLLGLQFLIEGARTGERGVLFTLEETPDQLRTNALGMGWDLAALEAAGLLVVKYTSPVELSTDRFLYEARNEVHALGARRTVFDGLTTMALGVPSEGRFKELVYSIAKHMRSLGVTLVMTQESEQLLGAAQLSGKGVSFIADNLVQLRYVELDGRLERAVSVLKARGIPHDSQLRALRIAKGGLTVVRDRFKDMRGVLTGLPARNEDPR